MGKPHIDQRPATEIHAPRDVVPEQHGKHARNAEDQRKGKEVPFLPKKIDVYVMKELQGQAPSSEVPSFKVSTFQRFKAHNSMVPGAF
jgi:hypothetical protein